MIFRGDCYLATSDFLFVYLEWDELRGIFAVFAVFAGRGKGQTTLRIYRETLRIMHVSYR